MPFYKQVQCSQCGETFKVDRYADKRSSKKCAKCAPIREQMLDLDYRRQHRVNTAPERNSHN